MAATRWILFLGGGSYQLISSQKFSVESIFEIFGVERFQRRLIRQINFRSPNLSNEGGGERFYR